MVISETSTKQFMTQNIDRSVKDNIQIKVMRKACDTYCTLVRKDCVAYIYLR